MRDASTGPSAAAAAVPPEHEHEWIDATVHSSRASTLVECAEPGCDEIGYRLR